MEESEDQGVQFGDYHLAIVYGNITPSLAEEITSLWTTNGVVKVEEAQRRTSEVVLTIRDSGGTLIGVNSVYVQDLIKPGNPYYFYRIFIRPQDRRSYGLRNFAGKTAREFLKHYTRPAGLSQPLGVVIVVENRKLRRPGANKLLARQGWKTLGKGRKGFDVWYQKFDGGTISFPHPSPPVA